MRKLRDKKPGLPRVERIEETHIEDETGHLWAVSYADFLMVLLSFFIIFFSVDEKDQEDVIQKILTATTSTEGSGLGAGKGPGEGGSGDGYRGVAALPTDALKEVLDKWNIDVDQNDKRVIFMFRDNVYKLGQIRVTPELKDQISSLVKALEPFSNDIDVEFVGHTDFVPITRSRSHYLNDNFSLSVLRAARAVQFAMAKGFPGDRLAAKGSAEKKRNTRSLSMVIRPRNETL